MDIQQLISYIHELQTQNKQLQKHIFNIQQQLDQKNQSIVLLTKKNTQFNQYITKCQQQIIKRQERQLLLIKNVQELNKQMGLYVEEIQKMKRDVENVGNRNKDISRDRIKQDINNDSDMKISGVRSMKLPPKSHQKCRNCQLLLNDRDILILELQKQKQKAYMLSRDIQCMIGTFCNA